MSPSRGKLSPSQENWIEQNCCRLHPLATPYERPCVCVVKNGKNIDQNVLNRLRNPSFAQKWKTRLCNDRRQFGYVVEIQQDTSEKIVMCKFCGVYYELSVRHSAVSCIASDADDVARDVYLHLSLIHI